jgi:hypothetical protein
MSPYSEYILKMACGVSQERGAKDDSNEVKSTLNIVAEN